MPDAFEVDAIDYLVKPVALERLMHAIDKARLLTGMKHPLLRRTALRLRLMIHFLLRVKHIRPH